VRRIVGVAVGVAVALALHGTVARAGELVQATPRADIGAAVMMRLFGETSDSSASFAAAHGDRTSESPLRELALQVPAADKGQLSTVAGIAFNADQVPLSSLSAAVFPGVTLGSRFTAEPSAVRFTVSSGATGDAAVLVPPGQHFTVAYQPVPAQPAISPAPGTLAFTPPETGALDFIPPAAQIGSVRFDTHAGDQSSEGPQLSLRDATYGAGANFDVRAGRRNLNLNLSSEYSQAANGLDSFSASSLGSASTWQASSGSAPLFLPNSIDLNRLSLGAGVSVPVVRGLTLNLNYDAQRLYGGYSLPGFVNLDTISNTYGGKLTFNIPRTSSSLSIGAFQDRFQDSVLPISGQTQTREDVNFTVKF
jgi:hypothetical protein